MTSRSNPRYANLRRVLLATGAVLCLIGLDIIPPPPHAQGGVFKALLLVALAVILAFVLDSFGEQLFDKRIIFGITNRKQAARFARIVEAILAVALLVSVTFVIGHFLWQWRPLSPVGVGVALMYVMVNLRLRVIINQGQPVHKRIRHSW
jgi:hypothetical protein